MVLEPVSSVSSVDFYTQVSRQSPARSFGYLCYLGVLFALTATLALKLKIAPVLDETFDWLSRSVPPMTYAEGRLTSTATAPIKLQSPRLPEIAFLIDTSRTEPVTAAQMEQAKVMAYVTANAFYLRRGNGQIEPWDFSKTTTANQKPVQIDAAFFKSAGVLLARVLYPLTMAVVFLIFLVWKSFSSLVFSVVALMINAISQAGLGYAELLNIAVYAQTLVIAVQAASLFLPFTVPGAAAISLALTGLYIWLAVKRHSPASPPQPA